MYQDFVCFIEYDQSLVFVLSWILTILFLTAIFHPGPRPGLQERHQSEQPRATEMDAQEPTPLSSQDPQDKCCYICKNSDEALFECTKCSRLCDSLCAWLHNSQSSNIKEVENWQCPDCTANPGTIMVGSKSIPLCDWAVDTTKASPKQNKKSSKKHKTQFKGSTSTKRRRSPASVSPPLAPSSPSLSPRKVNAANREDVSISKLPTIEHDSEGLQAAINTIQIHLSNLHALRTQNSQLQQEKTQLKQQVDDKDAFIWELKERNENLEARVTELGSQYAALRDKLQKIRRLSGVDVLGDNGDSQ